MADLTAPPSTPLTKRGSSMQSYVIKDTVVLAVGAYVIVEGATGTLTHNADVAGQIRKGIVVDFEDLDHAGTQTGATGAAEPPRAIVDESGGTLEKVPVAGASALTHVGDAVHLITDNPYEDLTLTPGATETRPVGTIVAFHSATQFDVELYSSQTEAAL